MSNSNERVAIPTVDQIAKDAITQIAHRYWCQQDEKNPLEAFDPKLIEDIYLNELLKTNFSLRRIMLLEFSQYLENYLWKNFQSDQTTKAHLLSIVIMVNEKFRERVFAWDCFRTQNQAEFPAFFNSILHLCLDKFPRSQECQLSYQEQSILIKFLDNCINSLEVELIRLQIQKICGFPMWFSLCDNRRDHEFKLFPKLKKYWKALQKQDQKLSQIELEKVNFERFFFKNLINKFLKVVNICPKQEDGQLDEDLKYSINYLERFLELLIDIESLLPTRRFFNTLLDDTNLLTHCYLSDLVKKSDEKYNLFKQLFEMLKFYAKFEIDDQTGEAKTEPQVLESHYNKLKSLQRGVFKYFRQDLLTFSLTNISTIDKRDTLLKHLSGLSNHRLYSLAEYLHLVPTKESIQDLEYSSEFLIECIVWHMQLRNSQLDELNSKPLYPTEDVIWNENLVPSDFRQTTFHDTCLALPKLNLQFLTLNDYLMRNFNLFRLEAAYELRQDIEDACVRLKPHYSFEEQTVCFGAWSRMAQPITNFTLIEVGSPNVGEQAPSRVRADVTLDLDFLRDDVRKEWESMRKYDIGFLVTIRPTFSKEQKFDPKDSFVRQMGLLCVRGCEIEGMLGPEGKLIEEGPMYSKPKFTDASRTYRVNLDRNQYKIDNENFIATKSKEDLYTTFNVFIRRRPKENNFKSILESIRDLVNTNFVVPDWLSDLLLGYGEPNQAHYKNLKKPEPIVCLDFNDTFLDYDHLKASFPDYQMELKEGKFSAPFRLSFQDLKADCEEKKIIVEPYQPINRGPYPKNVPKKNQVKFTPTQVEAIKSGMQPGLTMVVGPPGTGKTDVAVQIISNIYHNFPNQKTLIVTHSNQALNQIFEKIMHLDIDERHLLRLGHGEEELETEKDFSRYGRVNYILAKRLELLDEVDRLQKTFEDVLTDSAAYSCETASHFYTNYIRPKWESYMIKIQKLIDQNDDSLLQNIEAFFPFGNFYSNAPQPLFKKESWQNDLEIAKGCFRYIKRIFNQLDEFRAFELIRNGADRAEYLLVKEAKIIAMTCTHAALRRRDLVKMNFRYDNILMEEAAQILEIETFIPLLLQDPDHNGHNRLKRWIMIGDHNQLPPVIKNQTFQKYSNMEQSLFTRFVKLGIPTVDLDAQGRARSSLCELFSWRYKNLGSLSHVNEQDEFKKANTGFKFDYQLVNVEDFNGIGESEPQPYFYQNLAEAEYVVAVFMYMRMIGYPGEKITILSTYNGQKQLIREVLRKRCANNAIIGLPKKITTVDKYQGQQNDYILLSLVKTRNVGHLRDVRRLIVAMSRARLGLYIFCRCQLFRSCYELTPVFNILTRRPTKLSILPSEFFPTERMLDEKVTDGFLLVNDMPEMTQFVFDFYKSRLEAWKKNKREMELVEQRLMQEERRRKLDEEEKVLRQNLEAAGEKLSRRERLRIQADETSSEESENENELETKMNAEQSEVNAEEIDQKADQTGDLNTIDQQNVEMNAKQDEIGEEKRENEVEAGMNAEQSEVNAEEIDQVVQTEELNTIDQQNVEMNAKQDEIGEEKLGNEVEVEMNAEQMEVNAEQNETGEEKCDEANDQDKME